MYTIFSTITFSLFEWLFVAILPFILIFTTVFYILWSKKSLQKLHEDAEAVTQSLNSLENYGIDNFSHLAETAADIKYEPLRKAIENILNGSEQKYAKRWLPDLAEELNEEKVSDKQLNSCLYFTPSVLIFSCSLLIFYIFSLLPIVNPEIFPDRGILTYIPLIIGSICTLCLLNHRHFLKKELKLLLQNVQDTISKYLPVYTEKDGLALLVNEMTEHEDKIHQDLIKFNENLDQFVSEEFNQTVSYSIQSVMQEQIVPPIEKSSNVLSSLAEHLAEQQNAGMAELANHFSENLNETSREHFKAITGELSSFNNLMEDTTNFIHDSIAILENSRQQNILLNREVTDSIQLMTVSKNDLANEMAEISSFMEVLADVTKKMTSIYAGEDANLNHQIQNLEDALHNSLSIIHDGMVESRETIDLSMNFRKEQADQFEQLTERMNALLNDLKTINGSIHSATENFSATSTAKVENTLNDFENVLADIVERLIFTTAEIKDAVEGLPLAIQGNQKSNH